MSFTNELVMPYHRCFTRSHIRGTPEVRPGSAIEISRPPSAASSRTRRSGQSQPPTSPGRSTRNTREPGSRAEDFNLYNRVRSWDYSPRKGGDTHPPLEVPGVDGFSRSTTEAQTAATQQDTDPFRSPTAGLPDDTTTNEPPTLTAAEVEAKRLKRMEKKKAKKAAELASQDTVA